MKSDIRIAPFVAALALTWFSCNSGDNPTAADENDPRSREREEVLFTLYQNAPNPFNGSTLIRFRLEKSLAVHLKVGNRTVLNEVKEGPAVHYVVYQASADMPNGEYDYTLEASGKYQLKTMLLLR